MLMCVGSFIICVIPTYQQIGIGAPILLLLARLLQGLSLGGEYATSATYLSEMSVSKHRGFYSSFQYVTLIGGQVLAALVLLVMQAVFTAPQLESWGWRVPFAIGALCAVYGLYLRRKSRGDARLPRRQDHAPRQPAQRGVQTPARTASGVRPDRGRHRRVLYLQHLHADLPGQHGQVGRASKPTCSLSSPCSALPPCSPSSAR